MGSSDAGRQTSSCIATLFYCERGACGPDGAGWHCCSSTFFSESRTPPEVGGVIGTAPLAGWDCDAGELPRIEAGLRSPPAIQAKNRLVTKKPAARMAVVRLNRLAVPRAATKPPTPPPPT